MSVRTLFILLILGLFSFPGQSQMLSDRARVSLITCGPGTDLYATFGHSALHVYDPQTGTDRVYNYGTFDFDTEGFYIKFTRGKLKYMLSTSTFAQFARTYQYEGRWMYRQVLNLDQKQKQQLYAFLEENAEPENRYYKYDFFYDNCSTRIRDALELVLGDNLGYPNMTADTSATFRELIQLYLYHHPWSDLGIDLALGLPCDEEANFREKMFLPDYLMANMGKATIIRDGQVEPLISKHGLILEENPALSHLESEGILWIFWTLFAICLITSILVPPNFMRWFDIPFFGLTGILGIFILLLWFATDHSATKWNLNILWALPTWLYAAFMIARKKLRPDFFKIHAILMFLIMIFWILIPQNFHPATIPIILALTARSWSWQKFAYYVRRQTS